MSFPWLERLRPWNPLDHLRLLWWVLVTPQWLRAYREAFGEKAESEVGKWLISTLTWLPLFILSLAIGMGALPSAERAILSGVHPCIGPGLAVVWFLTGWFGDKNDQRASGLALGVVLIMMIVMAVFAAGDMEIGVTGMVALGVALLVSLSIGVGVASFVVNSFTDVGFIVALGVLGAIILVMVLNVMMFVTGGITRPVMYEELSIVAGVVGGIVIGVAFIFTSSVRRSLETGQPSWIARGVSVILVLAYVFLFWFGLCGGWQMF